MKKISKHCITFLFIISLLVLLAAPAFATYGDEPELMCGAALLYDAGNGDLLLDHNMYEKMYPASTTKIMTALLVLEHTDDLTQTITCSKSALNAVPSGSSIAGLKVGEEMTLYDMLVCLLVPSGNDAANVLAEFVSGSIDEFVALMNQRAEELLLENTHFVNTSGLHDEEHYTCAYDLLQITLEALKHPVFVEICGKSQASVPATNVTDKERVFNTTNFLLSRHKYTKYLYSYATGIKTGSTTPAQNCLVASAQKGDRKLISVVLKAPTITLENSETEIHSFTETVDLFEWGFNRFNSLNLLHTSDVLAEVKVNEGEERDFVVLCPAETVSRTFHHSITKDDFTYEYDLDENITAPVEAGTVLGKVTVSKDGIVYTTTDLVAMNSVSRSDILYYYDETVSFLSQDWLIHLVFAVLGFLIFYLILVLIIGAVRRKNRRARRRHR